MDEELKDKVQRIKNLQAVIDSCENNLHSYDRVFDYDEIKISNNTVDPGAPIYFTGVSKSEIKRLLVMKEEKRMKDAEEELRELLV